MFRNMRRPRQELTEAEIVNILKVCTTGVLAVWGDGEYPYTIPLNYAYDQGKLFFHCALEGHKMDGIKKSDKVSFCVIEKDDVIAEALNTNYKSVIVFGRARILDDSEQRKTALEKIGEKYSLGFWDNVQEEIKKDWDRVALVEISIENMTGKKGSRLL